MHQRPHPCLGCARHSSRSTRITTVNGASLRYSPWLKAVSESSQVNKSWAHVDLNHGPRPYQGRALTELSYGPNLGIGKCIAADIAQREPGPMIPTTQVGHESLSVQTRKPFATRSRSRALTRATLLTSIQETAPATTSMFTPRSTRRWDQRPARHSEKNFSFIRSDIAGRCAGCRAARPGSATASGQLDARVDR